MGAMKKNLSYIFTIVLNSLFVRSFAVLTLADFSLQWRKMILGGRLPARAGM